MAEGKEGVRGRCQIMKCLRNHDKRLSVLPGDTKKSQGDSWAMRAFIWTAEAHTCSLMLLSFHCIAEKERDR